MRSACIIIDLGIERSVKVSIDLSALTKCADRIYKYWDNDPCRVFQERYLRQRDKTKEAQGAPFKTGMMATQPLSLVIPSTRPRFRIKSAIT